MDFIKATDKLPTPMKKVFFKYTKWVISHNPNIKDTPKIERYVGYMASDECFKGGWDEDVGDFLTFDIKNVEWLDEG